MKLSTIGFALAACVGLSYAATDTVWTAQNGEGTMAPATWYPYTYGTGSAIDVNIIDTYKVVDYTAAATSTSNGAGYAFQWAQNASYEATPITLASYKGVCLTYKADKPLRLDFMQSTISDGNY